MSLEVNSSYPQAHPVSLESGMLDHAMLTIHCTNHYEALTDRVMQVLDSPGESPLAPSHLIVPNAGVRRALSIGLARHRGVAANLQFDFLAQWLWRRVAAVLPNIAPQSPYAAPGLGWRLLGVFAELSSPDAVRSGAIHPRLLDYLASVDELVRYDFAMQLGRCFEQYTTYRPDWLQAWQAHQLSLQAAAHPAQLQADEQWQAHLWRMLQHQIEPQQTDPIQGFIETLGTLSRVAWQALGQPSQVQVIALAGISPLHARMLHALSHVMQIHVHVMNPCQEYWFDLVDARRLSHLRMTGRAQGFEEGHPLLAAWGRQTQAHVGVLVEAFANQFEDEGSYRKSRQSTLLGALQDSVLELSPLGPGSLPPALHDSSIEIHACHSLIRQLEVLHNRLLGLMAEPSVRLGPHEVLVVLPDLEAAAPSIDAVFGAVPDERKIPYRISGLPQTSADSIAPTLLALFNCVMGRAGITQVLELLENPWVADAFELSQQELDLIRDWMREAGVHWGLDPHHRSIYPGNPESGHTLTEGLDRLFLSYALPSALGEGVAGDWPAGDVQGNQALVLGKLDRFSRELSRLASRAHRPQPPAQWQSLILGILDRFFVVPDAQLHDLLGVRRQVLAMFAEMQGLPANHDLGGSVVLRALTQTLRESARGAMPTGVVTFCAPAQLRYLPFRVIAFLGLDDGAYPSRPPTNELDLMAQAPRWGDRQRRDDERNVFLDLLLAARERLILGYTGFSIRDNAILPPSVIVSELLDTLSRACPDDVRQALVVVHPLQAFDRRGFLLDADLRMRSYDTSLARTWQRVTSAVAQGQALDGPPAFFSTDPVDDPLPKPAERPSVHQQASEEQILDIEDLLTILCDPAGALLRYRTGLRFDRDPEPLQDQEPLVLSKAVHRTLDRLAVQGLLSGQKGEALAGRLAATPGVPRAHLGQRSAHTSLSMAGAFVTRIQNEWEVPALAECSLDWRVPIALSSDSQGSLRAQAVRFHAVLGRPFRRTWAGRLEQSLRESGLVLWAPELALERALLAGWVHHLALLLALPEGAIPETRVHTLRHTLRFRGLEQAPEHLSQLISLTLQACHQPMPFFPRESLMYIQKGAAAVESVWTEPRDGQWSQAQRPEVQLVWRGLEPPFAHPQFESIALEVYSPLLAACEVRDA